MTRGKAFRRKQLAKKKKQARLLWYRWFSDSWTNDNEPTEKWIGLMASTHCRPCSCCMCSGEKGHKHPRFNRVPTWQEKDNALKMYEQLLDFYNPEDLE